MKWYTAIGCKMEDDEGRLLVKIGGQEKVLTEMESVPISAGWTVLDLFGIKMRICKCGQRYLLAGRAS